MDPSGFTLGLVWSALWLRHGSQPLFAPVPSATAPCIAIILIAAVVRFVTIRAAARFGSEAAERVKLALREKLFNKMLALGPSYAQRVRTAGVVRVAAKAYEQSKASSNCSCRKLCYAVLAPITLFAVLAPIDLPTAATLLACAPLIVLIVGMVAMRAAAYSRNTGQIHGYGRRVPRQSAGT